MGTISDKLMRIINTKEDIRRALISKGYDVPTSIPFKEYAKMILDLPCNADSFPDIEGIVARYSALGLTNEQMEENPVWKDLTGNGHDLQMKNFAWGGMSGVGGYEMNFNLWTSNVPSIPDISMSTTTTSVSVSVGNSTYNNNLIYIHINNWDINKNHWLKVTSTYEDGDLVFKFYNDNNSKNIELPANGYVNIPAYPEFKGNYMYISTTSNKQGSFTIEQLPLYPGALVFDGVDDYGTCENFPILTKEKGYTVVALRQWLSFQDIGYPTLVVNSTDRLAAFSFEDFRSKTKSTWNWGRSAGLSDYEIPLLYTYQTSTSYNSKTIYAGATEEGSNILQVCRSGVYCANAAIWEIVILDHDATEEELTKIKDYFVKTYPWLFPDQAWTVVGKTNEDEDRATIANITGNGNDLVLSNFAFSGNSGYGEYAYNFNDTSWISIPDYGVISDKTSKSFNIKSFVLADYPVLYTAVNKDSSIKKVKIKVTNSIPGFYFGNKPANQIIDLSTDGIYEIPSYNSPNDVTQYGFRCSNVNDSCNITIEQIPEYEGYLVTDGVDDEVRSAAFTLNKDWTIVGNWEFITNENKNAGLTKVYSFYLYNRDYGIFVYKYTNAGQGFSVEDVKSLKAICSDGRIYLNDWQEIRNNIEQEATISKGVMAIGYFNRDFTKVAFKNLGIYNNQLLSKDDCIKAYNYLQTLKSK